MVNNIGKFVISLDFELMWGGIDIWDEQGYGQTNISKVRKVVDRLISLFEKYHVKATFATVGLIMQTHENTNDLQPEKTPTYNNDKLNPFKNRYIDNIKDSSLFFAPDLIEKLKQCKNIEIGTHTYSHYYCWEEGQTVAQFEADIQKAVEVAKNNNIELKSIVFPRNQVSPEYLEICYKYGITSYRGNALKYFNIPKSKFESIKNRLCRLLDAYFNIGGYTSYKFIPAHNQIQNIPASRFLRPYIPKLAFADGLRLKRIKKEMLHAAQFGEVYHIWWHPHNFGDNMCENLKFLEQIMIYFDFCNKKYGMISNTMKELSHL